MEVDDSLPPVPVAPLLQQAATLPETRRRPPVVPAEVEPAFPPSLLHMPDPGASGPPPSLADRTLAVLPPAWAPIIARDTAEARGVQQPYSEAYLSGQPNKRRKLNCDKKPRGDVANIISRSLQVADGREVLSGPSPVIALLQCYMFTLVLYCIHQQLVNQDAIEQTGLEPATSGAVAEVAAAPVLQEAVEIYTRQNFQVG